MTATAIRFNQFHSAADLPHDLERCNCKQCKAKRAEAGADDDEAVTMTRGELESFIGKAVKKAVTKAIAAQVDEDEDLDDDEIEGAIAANFASAYGDEPLTVSTNRLRAQAAEARRARRDSSGVVDDFAPDDDSLAAITDAARRRRAASR